MKNKYNTILLINLRDDHFSLFSEKETIVSYLNMEVAKIFNQLIFFQSLMSLLRFSKRVLSPLSIALVTVSLYDPL